MPLATPQQLLQQAKANAQAAAELALKHPVPPNTPVGAGGAAPSG